MRIIAMRRLGKGECMRVGLLVTCLIDLMRPEIGFSVIKLLEAAGCEVEVPEAQTCCGQPAFSSGDFDTARALAQNVIAAFETYDYVVIPSGSCGGNVKTHYESLFKDDEQWLTRVRKFCTKVYELTDFLHQVVKLSAVPDAKQSSAIGTITYHDSCCGLRELGVQAQPRALLKTIAGLDVCEMADSRSCCGFGGTFALKYGDISTAIVDEKCAQIKQTGAQAVVLGDLGCMLNIEGRLRRNGDSQTRVLHVAQVLAGDLE